MSQYDEVVTALRSPFYGWTILEAPHPEPVGVALQTQTPEQVATALDGYLVAQSVNYLPPYGATESSITILRRRLFTIGCKYWALNTSIALGQQVEIPVPSEGPAQGPQDWFDRQDRLVNRLGEALCSKEEFERRNVYAAGVPAQWRSFNMDPTIYQLAVREGYLPVGMEMFDPAYLQSNPRLKDVRGLSADMWLQNLQAVDKGKPIPWLPGGQPNPAVK